MDCKTVIWKRLWFFGNCVTQSDTKLKCLKKTKNQEKSESITLYSTCMNLILAKKTQKNNKKTNKHQHKKTF